jgi:hypothetical protein
MGSRPAIGRAALLVAVLVAVLAPSGAEAAKVVNGGFESGTLNGWQERHATGAGSWFAYTGTDAPIGSKRPKPADPVQAPPQGDFAATTDEANPDALILYQDVALEPDTSHHLSLLAYYDSYKPIAVPTPDTLSVSDEVLGLPGGQFQQNQQFRIDVIKPEAPLESLDPADILRTVFVTKPGDSLTMPPTSLTANLSTFAGQTVRIRIANSVTEEVFNAGVDAVSISTGAPGKKKSAPHGTKQGADLFSFDKIRAYRGKGIATLSVRVSGSGLLRAKGAPVSLGAARTSSSPMLSKPIEPVTVPIASAKTVTIHLRPTPRTRAILRGGRKLRVGVGVTFMPTGGSPETASVPVVFKLESHHPRQR